jgi:hypothetical protein
MANCRAYSNEFMMPIPEVWLRQTVGVLICFQELEDQVELQRQTITRLEHHNDQLEARLQRLEALIGNAISVPN